jgi:hypothetical protein
MRTEFALARKGLTVLNQERCHATTLTLDFFCDGSRTHADDEGATLRLRCVAVYARALNVHTSIATRFTAIFPRTHSSGVPP